MALRCDIIKDVFVLCGLQASNGTLCVDLSGNDNGGLVTGCLCSASDVKVTYRLALLMISVIYLS